MVTLKEATHSIDEVNTQHSDIPSNKEMFIVTCSWKHKHSIFQLMILPIGLIEYTNLILMGKHIILTLSLMKCNVFNLGNETIIKFYYFL